MINPNFKIEQIYTGCLAQGAYYITSNGEAAIIDPLRETQPYIERLNRDHVILKYIFETHFHADFVSGHIDLNQKTAAPIVYGPTAKPAFKCIEAVDGQEFLIGSITLKVLHTPGHTLESTCYLLIDENGKNQALFSGDTLFIGDVGRPDLVQKIASMTQDDLATLLFHSLRNKIMTLEDDVLVYPAHGAGSACGKNMSKETVSTIGNQKLNNYALRANMTVQEFIDEVTSGLLPPPEYFGGNVAMNKLGYDNFDNVFNNGMTLLTIDAFKSILEATDALIIDTRDASIFCQGFIPQSINIGINGDFAPWVGTLIKDVKQPILFVSEPNKMAEVVTRVSRVGFDNILGHVSGGFEAWKAAGNHFEVINRISASQFEAEIDTNAPKIIDVRKLTEYEAQHVNNALSKPLAYINDWISEIDKKEKFYIHCAGGYRSMAAASILAARGYQNFSEIAGGFKAILDTKVSTTQFVCQSTPKN
ncbi:MAG: MBL fold metallo-hydrolase [Alphaproteobacteria bacterium]|nr:MBL fold metallo-hydrolase [Alphaproteobacteria bacterium]